MSGSLLISPAASAWENTIPDYSRGLIIIDVLRLYVFMDNTVHGFIYACVIFSDIIITAMYFRRVIKALLEYRRLIQLRTASCRYNLPHTGESSSHCTLLVS